MIFIDIDMRECCLLHVFVFDLKKYYLKFGSQTLTYNSIITYIDFSKSGISSIFK